MTEELKSNLQEIVVGLCEISNRCPICYDTMTESTCNQCGESYGDCPCKPLTRKQIEESIW